VKKLDFLSHRYFAYSISILSLIATIVLYFIPATTLQYGVDFRGGTELHLKFSKHVNDEVIRKVLKEECGLKKNFQVQSTFSGGIENVNAKRDESNEKIIKMEFLGTTAYKDTATGEEVLALKEVKEKLGAGLAKADKDLKIVDTLRETSVGPSVGKELTNQALFALFVSLFGILAYVTVQFEFKFAVPSIIALFHDVIITVGFIMITGKEFDMSQLAVLLTIVGYSINDTVIICDRIRENAKIMRKVKYYDMVNESLAQVFSRTIITVLTVELSLVAIYFFGGELSAFASSLMFGTICGVYSSIYVVSPMIVTWKEYEEKVVA